MKKEKKCYKKKKSFVGDKKKIMNWNVVKINTTIERIINGLKLNKNGFK